MGCRRRIRYLALMGWLWSIGAEASPSSPLTVRAHGPRLDVIARDVPFDILMDRLAGACGVRISLRRPDRTPFNVVLKNQTVAGALEHLLGGYDTVVVSGRDRIETIYVYGRRSEPPAGTEIQAPDHDEDNREAAYAEGQARSSAGIEALEALLRSDGGRSPIEVPSELLRDPDPNIRATALQWTAGKGDAFVDAVAISLTDDDSMVQSAARELLLARGISGEGWAELQSVAELGDAKGIRDLLATLLPPQ